MINSIELLAVATITILAVISPGADFAMVTRNSILHGRSAGLLASLGIATGVQLHVFYTMVGVGVLIRSSPDLFSIIKFLGAIYLIYVGYKTFSTHAPTENIGVSDRSGMNFSAAFRSGFLTNALNPKTTLFVVSIYTQVIHPNTPLWVQVMYGLFMSFAHWIWFSLVCLLLSQENLRNRLLQRQAILNRGIGLVLASLGLMLSLSSMTAP